jgi:hypothetical protein
MNSHFTPKQKLMVEELLKKKFSSFGEFKEVDMGLIDVYAGTHPICPIPVGYCGPTWGFMSGPDTGCPGGGTTTTYCGS